MDRVPPRLPRSLCLALVLALGAATLPARGAESAPRSAFRVCKDPHNMPFTNAKGEGYEDKLAQLFARELGLPLETYAFPQRLGFIRNTLRFKVPGADYPCDVVMGVPEGFGQVMETKPYYRSTYVLVLRTDRGLEGVKSEADFLALPRERLAGLKIGVFDRSPGSAWLDRHQLVDSGVPFRVMNADPEDYPGEIIERELAAGKIDAAVVWGPIGAWFAHQVKGADLRVVPLASDEGVKFDYTMAMGVRFGEGAWKRQLEEIMDRRHAEIEAILQDYGVPLLALPAEPAGAQVAKAAH